MRASYGRVAIGGKTMSRFLPGIAGAAGAFIALKLISLGDIADLGLQIVIYVAAYVVVTVAADRAMVRYGQRHEPRA
jgi:hypothetical protein